MGASVRDHPVNEDDADRHARPRRVPAAIAMVVALLAAVALAYSRGAFR